MADATLINNISSAVLDAVDIVVNKAIQNAGFDKTIQATVISCKDAASGLYELRYQDSIFQAHSADVEKAYSKDAQVFVLIPNGDLSSSAKVITSEVSSNGVQFNSVLDNDSYYENIGSNWITSELTREFKIEDEENVLYDVSNMANNKITLLDKDILYDTLRSQENIKISFLINSILNNFKKFSIVIDIDFWLNVQHTDNITRSYKIDLGGITGNPLHLVDSKQSFYFPIDSRNFKNISKIYLVCDKLDDLPKEEIAISNLEIYAVSKLSDEARQGFSLTLETPDGLYFKESLDALHILPTLRVNGIAMDRASNAIEFYWFKNNPTINERSDKYLNIAGNGWECLNNQGNSTVLLTKTNYNKNNSRVFAPFTYNTFNITSDLVPGKYTKFKCICIYKQDEKNICEKEIQITNYNARFEGSLVTGTGTRVYTPAYTDTDTITFALNDSLNIDLTDEEKNDIIYIWTKTTASGSIEEVVDENGNLINAQSITFTPLEIVDNVTYTCICLQDGSELCSASIRLMLSNITSDTGYNLLIHNGNAVFKYDANGFSPYLTDANSSSELPLSFSLYDPNGIEIPIENIADYDIVWRVPVTKTLLSFDNIDTSVDSTAKTDATGATELGKYYDINAGVEGTGKFLPFTINSKYQVEAKNNNIILTIKYEDIEISASTNFSFLKDGDVGTTGTGTTCVVQPNDRDNKISYPVISVHGANPQYGYLNFNSVNDCILKATCYQDNSVLKPYQTMTILNSTTGALTYPWRILRKVSGTSSSNLSYFCSENSVNEIVNWNYENGRLLFEDMSEDAENKFILDDKGSDIIEFTYQETGITTNDYEEPSDEDWDNIVNDDPKDIKPNFTATLPIIMIHYANDYNTNRYQVEVAQDSGFYYVVYSSDGYKPSYVDSPFILKVMKDGEDYTDKCTYSWKSVGDANNVLLINETGEEIKNSCRFKPGLAYSGLETNISAWCDIMDGSNIIAKVKIPIHFMLNRYEQNDINGWSGNGVNIDNDGGVILATKVGAGIKEADNSFTGMIMGKVQSNDSDDEADIGLFGYGAGVRTFLLDARTGGMTIGAAGSGQLSVSAQGEGIMKSANYPYLKPGDNSTPGGMKIDFTNATIETGTGNFSVDNKGCIVAREGTIGSWHLTDKALYSDKHITGMTPGVGKTDIAFWAGREDDALEKSGTDKFHVTGNGDVKMESASMADGKIVLDENGFNIGDKDKPLKDRALKITTDGTIDTEGNIYARGDINLQGKGRLTYSKYDPYSKDDPTTNGYTNPHSGDLFYFSPQGIRLGASGQIYIPSSEKYIHFFNTNTSQAENNNSWHMKQSSSGVDFFGCYHGKGSYTAIQISKQYKKNGKVVKKGTKGAKLTKATKKEIPHNNVYQRNKMTISADDGKIVFNREYFKKGEWHVDEHGGYTLNANFIRKLEYSLASQEAQANELKGQLSDAKKTMKSLQTQINKIPGQIDSEIKEAIKSLATKKWVSDHALSNQTSVDYTQNETTKKVTKITLKKPKIKY